MVITSWPITRTVPESGRSNPAAIFISRVFPVPLSPSKTFVSPWRTSNEIERRTSRSPKPMEMSRKEIRGSPGAIFSIMGWLAGAKPGSARPPSARLWDDIGGGRSVVIGGIIDVNAARVAAENNGADASRRRLEKIEKQLRNKGVYDQNEHGGDHDRRGGGAANALRPA